MISEEEEEKELYGKCLSCGEPTSEEELEKNGGYCNYCS